MQKQARSAEKKILLVRRICEKSSALSADFFWNKIQLDVRIHEKYCLFRSFRGFYTICVYTTIPPPTRCDGQLGRKNVKATASALIHTAASVLRLKQTGLVLFSPVRRTAFGSDTKYWTWYLHALCNTYDWLSKKTLLTPASFARSPLKLAEILGCR